ncbi:MAG: diacylglycerol/lipid kinase family protein [Dehalococcoidia bacterium]
MVIVNPVSGGGITGKTWPQIMELLKTIGLSFEYEFTEARGHATELAKSAVKKGYELVVSVGGDGTMNEIVNGLHDAGGLANTMLGIINTGTGCDYVRTIGIPRSYKEACQRLINPRKLVADLGIMDFMSNRQMVSRLFVNFAGLGVDAEIVRATTQKFKSLGSTLSYLMGLLVTLLSYRNKDISITVDGESKQARVCEVLMCNGRYGGGGMLTAPNADLTDGLLDVLTVGDLSRPGILRSLHRIYKGTHLTHPRVTMQRGKEIEIQSSQQMLLQADGELVGEAPARFHVLPAALTVAT